MFLIVQSSDHITGLTGATPTVTISKAGAAFGAAAGTVTEVSSGWYKIAFTTADTGTVGDLAVHVTATSGDPTDFVDQISVRLIDDAAFPATSGRSMVVDASGLVDANAVKLGPTGSGTAQTARDIGASVLLSAGSGAGQLDFTSGVVKSNMVQILATVLTETAGLLAGGFKKFFNVATPTGTLLSLPDAVPGASGGLLIAGTNAALTSFTAGMIISNTAGDALELTSTGGSGSGLFATGNGFGSGIIGSGGANGNGFAAAGGASSGAGFKASASNAEGILSLGGGSGSNGMTITPGSGSAHGLSITGIGTGHGIITTGGSTSGDGLKCVHGGTGKDIRGNITGTIDTTTAVTNDVGITQAGADKVFGGSGAAMSEVVQAIPSATPNPLTALMLLYMVLRNKLTVSGSTKSFFNDAGVCIVKKAISDDGTTYTEAQAVSGP